MEEELNGGGALDALNDEDRHKHRLALIKKRHQAQTKEPAEGAENVSRGPWKRRGRPPKNAAVETEAVPVERKRRGRKPKTTPSPAGATSASVFSDAEYDRLKARLDAEYQTKLAALNTLFGRSSES